MIICENTKSNHGAAGVAAISPTALAGTLLPLVLGVVLGNLSPFIRGLLVPGKASLPQPERHQ